MEAVKEELENEAKEEIKQINKKNTILGINLWRLLAYFIVYSFLGFVVETIYGMLTKGLIESRQSFLYGPFCAIYGLGAIIMILFLQFFNKNNNHLFIGGFFIGSVIEYLVSLIGEWILHVKWWDYSHMPFNVNGRICIFFSIFWGLLAIYLMSYVNPKINQFIDFIKVKISIPILKIIVILINVILLVDCLITVYALSVFFIRKVHENDWKVANREIIDREYDRIYSNEKKANRIYRFFGDKKMIQTFPNLKIKDLEGNILYFQETVPNVKPYYYKLKSNPKKDLIEAINDVRK